MSSFFFFYILSLSVIHTHTHTTYTHSLHRYHLGPCSSCREVAAAAAGALARLLSGSLGLQSPPSYLRSLFSDPESHKGRLTKKTPGRTVPSPGEMVSTSTPMATTPSNPTAAFPPPTSPSSLLNQRRRFQPRLRKTFRQTHTPFTCPLSCPSGCPANEKDGRGWVF